MQIPIKSQQKISKEDAEKLLMDYRLAMEKARGLRDGPFKDAYNSAVENAKNLKERIINLMVGGT